MKTLGMTSSTCSQCRKMVPAKIIGNDDGVIFRKFCDAHGEMDAFVYRDSDEYLKVQRYVKPAWKPLAFQGDAARGCPDGCGFCDRHEQHVCMPIVEITTRCNLACPVCINDSGSRGVEPWDMTPAEFRTILDRLLQSELQIDVLNLSGGEPLIHPRLLDLVDEACSRPEIVRVSVSTNGLVFLDDNELLEALKARDVVVSLQFDGFEDDVYRRLRGRALLAEKLEVLAMLKDRDVTTSLTMTAAGGVNEDQFPRMLDHFFGENHLVSLMIQPLAFEGRGTGMAESVSRLTIPDIVQALGNAGHPCVKSGDFAPLPCSHPLCFSLAFYMMLDDGRGAVSLNDLVNASDMIDTLANRVIFGLDPEEHEKLRDMVYALWSGPVGAVPESASVLATIRSLLKALQQNAESCCMFDPRKAFTLVERRIKSIFIHAFQDAENFDLARVRRCCQAYPQPDGRLIPACVHNVLGRESMTRKTRE